MNISSVVSGGSNVASTSHISATHTYSFLYKVIPIIIIVDVDVFTVENNSVWSTPGTCMYPLTTFFGLKRIKPSVSSLLLNNHLTGTCFLTFTFTVPLLVVIHVFLGVNFYFRNCCHFPYISVYPCNCFLEGLGFSCVRRN